MELYVYVLVTEAISRNGFDTSVDVYFSEKAAKKALKERTDEKWEISMVDGKSANFPKGYDTTKRMTIKRIEVLS